MALKKYTIPVHIEGEPDYSQVPLELFMVQAIPVVLAHNYIQPGVDSERAVNAVVPDYSLQGLVFIERKPGYQLGVSYREPTYRQTLFTYDNAAQRYRFNTQKQLDFFLAKVFLMTLEAL